MVRMLSHSWDVGAVDRGADAMLNASGAVDVAPGFGDGGGMTNTHHLPTSSGIVGPPLRQTVTFTPNLPDGAFDTETLWAGNTFTHDDVSDSEFVRSIHTIVGFRHGQEMVTVTPHGSGHTSTFHVWLMVSDNVYELITSGDVVALIPDLAYPIS